MTMEKQAFEDVSPLLKKMMIFQPSMLVYLRVMPGCFINCEVYQQSLPIFFLGLCPQQAGIEGWKLLRHHLLSHQGQHDER